MARGVGSVLIEEARVLVVGETEVVVSTARRLVWRDAGRGLTSETGLERHDPTSGPDHQHHFARNLVLLTPSTEHDFL